MEHVYIGSNPIFPAMKIYTSYFYQIRNFKPYMIPISVCCTDPKWFHDFTGSYDYIFRDKRGIWNGLRADILHFPKEKYIGDNMCGEACLMESKDPSRCGFMTELAQYYNTIDFNYLLSNFERLANKIKEIEKFEEEPIIVLIVYEIPSNKCSEREVLHKWFKQNGYNLTELSYPIGENYL